MFYLDVLLTIRKSKQRGFQKCWLAATVHHQLVGSGIFRLPRKEVNAVDIAATCNDINGISGVEGAPQLSFYLASQLTIGALRISEKQVSDLRNDIELSLFNSIVRSPKQNDKKKKQGISLDNQPEISFDALQLFSENQIDNNCIQEDCHTVPKDCYIVPEDFGELKVDDIRPKDCYIVPEDFGELKIDDIRGYRLDDDPLAKVIADAQEFTNNPMAHHDRRESVQDLEIIMDADSEAIPIQISVEQISTKESQAQVLPGSTTPKRISYVSHCETLTKKKKVSTTVHFSIPNQPFSIPGEDVHENDGPALPAAAAMVVDEAPQVQQPVGEMAIGEYTRPEEYHLSGLSVGVKGAAEVSNDFVTPRPSTVHSRRLQTSGQILENDSQQIKTVRQSENGNKEDQLNESSTETDDTFLPRTGEECQEPSDGFEAESQRSYETSEISPDLSIEQFLDAIKQILNKSLELGGVPKLNVKEILPPAKFSREQFLKYFDFCLDLQRRGELDIVQEIIHGPIYITPSSWCRGRQLANKHQESNR